MKSDIRPVTPTAYLKIGQALYYNVAADARRADIALIELNGNRKGQNSLALVFPLSRAVRRIFAKPERQRDPIDREILLAHCNDLVALRFNEPLQTTLEEFLRSAANLDEPIAETWFSACGYCTFEHLGVRRFMGIYPNQGNLDCGEIAKTLRYCNRMAQRSGDGEEMLYFEAELKRGRWYNRREDTEDELWEGAAVNHS